MIYKKQSLVSASMCDSTKKLSAITAVQLVEDAVTELMGELKVDGITAMRLYNAMWVFTKNRIRVFRRPDWRERIEVRSFFSRVSSALIAIDTEVCGTDGAALIHARVELTAIDMAEKRIRRTGTVGISPDFVCAEPLSELDFTRFTDECGTLLETAPVRSTNIDYCRHTNNVEYIRFILNTYPLSKLIERELCALEVHYKAQTFEGDELKILGGASEGADRFAIVSNDKTAFECMLWWK